MNSIFKKGIVKMDVVNDVTCTFQSVITYDFSDTTSSTELQGHHMVNDVTRHGKKI